MPFVARISLACQAVVACGPAAPHEQGTLIVRCDEDRE
jgi:hypothetical protein